MSTNTGMVFTRDESKLREVPPWAVYTAPIALAVMFGGFVGVIYGIMRESVAIVLISLVLEVACAVYDVIINSSFNFYKDCKCSMEDTEIVFTYKLNDRIVPSGSTDVTVRVSCIKGYRLLRNHHGRTAEFRGSVYKKQPLRKEMKLKKVILPVDFTERDAFFEGIKKYMI